MSAESFKRKVAAILTTDAARYSRFMNDDGAETLRTVNLHLRIGQYIPT